jgi:hypothetical protein
MLLSGVSDSTIVERPRVVVSKALFLSDAAWKLLLWTWWHSVQRTWFIAWEPLVQ